MINVTVTAAPGGTSREPITDTHNVSLLRGRGPEHLPKSVCDCVHCLGLRQWRDIGRKFCFEDSGSFYLCPPPWVVLLEVISPELVLEAFFSQAHSSLSQRMLCCSLVALPVLILCEVLFLLMK